MSNGDCIFCKILKGDIPAHKVFENSNFFAFLDINPKSTGHCQLIPKKHATWVWDVENIGEYMEAARTVAIALRKAYGTDMIASRIMGDEVPHAHIWLFPLKHTKNDGIDFEKSKELIIGALG